MRAQWKKREVSENALLTQLEQYNLRARWYATQFWQIPLAYIGIWGVYLGSVREQPLMILFGTFVFFCVSIFVFFHMLILRNGDMRAVIKMKICEDQLHLTEIKRNTMDLGSNYFRKNTRCMLLLHCFVMFVQFLTSIILFAMHYEEMLGIWQSIYFEICRLYEYLFF